MFASASVSYLVCLLAGLNNNNSTHCHKTWRKGGTQTTNAAIRFWW